MRRQDLLRTLCLGVLCAALSLTLPAAHVIAQPGHKSGQAGKNGNQRQHRQHEQGGDRKPRKSDGKMSARQAAGQAQQRYGGQVLKVDQQGSGYNVRLLQDDGRVITVFIGD